MLPKLVEDAIFDVQQLDISVECVMADAVKPAPLSWLWPNRVPLAKLTVFAGQPDMGKSATAIDLVARATTGRPWPDCENDHGPVDALLMASEDDVKDTIVPRLMAAGADLSRVHIAMRTIVRDGAKQFERRIALDTDLDAIEKLLKEKQEIVMVILDPLSSYLGRMKKNSDDEIRAALEAMKDLAERHYVAVISIDHFNKNIQQAAIHRISGAGALGQVPRAAWCFVRDAEHPELRLMLNAKLNVVSDAKKAGLKFTFREQSVSINGLPVGLPVIDWMGASDKNLDELLHQNADPEERKASKGEIFLKEILAAGARPATEVFSEGETRSISTRTLYRCKDRMKITSVEHSGRWWWELPTGCQT